MEHSNALRSLNSHVSHLQLMNLVWVYLQTQIWCNASQSTLWIQGTLEGSHWGMYVGAANPPVPFLGPTPVSCLLPFPTPVELAGQWYDLSPLLLSEHLRNTVLHSSRAGFLCTQKGGWGRDATPALLAELWAWSICELLLRTNEFRDQERKLHRRAPKPRIKIELFNFFNAETMNWRILLIDSNSLLLLPEKSVLYIVVFSTRYWRRRKICNPAPLFCKMLHIHCAETAKHWVTNNLFLPH